MITSKRKIIAYLLIFVLTIIYSLMPITAMAENTYSYGDTQENGEFIEHSILTVTQGEPIGMQGFYGNYEIIYLDELVEIYVMFVTPPAVVLRLIQERDNSMESMVQTLIEDSFVEQSLLGHAVFQQQLAGIPMPLSATGEIEIITEYYWLFNGWLMRVPGSMVEMIAELPEVFGVFPNVEFFPAYAELEFAEFSQTHIVATNDEDSFFIDDDFMWQPRGYLGMENINRRMPNPNNPARSGITGRDVRVAVIDSGIQHDHPEFIRFQNPTTGYIRGRGDAGDGSNVHPSGDGHGTSVSGAVIGIAPNVELWHYRISFGDGPGGISPVEAVQAAHQEADAQVINMSFGTTTINHPFSPLSYAVQVVIEAGVVVVAAPGNSGEHGQFTVASPASIPGVITVGAGNAGGPSPDGSDDTMRATSSRGPVARTFHIKPDITAPSGVRTADIGSDYVDDAGGTSHSSPIIAGVAALILEAFPDATPDEVKARIMNTARPMPRAEANSVFISGAGFVQPYAALTANTFVTTTHQVPISVNPNNNDFIFENRTMSSLSFGWVDRRNNGTLGNRATIPITITNRGAARTFTISHSFTNNPNNAASLNFNNTSVFVPATNGTATINATMVIGNNATLGNYEGFVEIRDGNTLVARLPFAAVVIEGEVIINTANLSRNENTFTLNSVNMHTTGDFQGRNFRVETTVGANATITNNIQINAFNTLMPLGEIPAATRTFTEGQHVQILIYDGNTRVARHIIRPILFEF